MKKILFISPSYFDYYKAIINGLKNAGFCVDWFSDRPTQKNIFKAVSRINPYFVKKRVGSYFNQIINKTSKTEYDYVFFIRGMSYCFDNEMMHKLRKSQSNAKFICYQWDSIKNLKNIKEFWEFFDECYTFDRVDSLENENLMFLPLFFDNQYEKIGEKLSLQNSECLYDYCYIGTAHPNKYKVIEEISEKLKKKYNNQFIYHYMPSRLKYFYHKFKDFEYKDATMKCFKTKTLSKEKAIDIIKNSRIVLDAPQINQNGLTIRAIETLGANKKLITTNKDIVNYDFYNPINIYIYEGSIDFDSDFFNKPYQPISEEIYRNYSLSCFLKKLFTPFSI